MKKVVTISTFLLIALLTIIFIERDEPQSTNPVSTQPEINEGGPGTEKLHPLSIETLRQGEYPGSEIVIEQTLTQGSNYDRYIASYKSEGLKIYGLLTVPSDPTPENGWPAIIFNHGYINPDVYRTTERYTSYQNALAQNGYITFKPDYRGHGNSEGEARGGYGNNDYTIDVLNALSSIKRLSVSGNDLLVDPERIGMWGHSMGGHITLESMVVRDDIKAGVIWAGVVGTYEDLLVEWRPWWIRQDRPSPTPDHEHPRRRWRKALTEDYGSPSENPEFWDSISAATFVDDISGPLQLHHAPSDNHVPYKLSETLKKRLLEAGKNVELFAYEGDDHNLSANLNTALQRSVEFFDKHLKQ